MSDPEPAARPRRVRRGEGEVTQWPRGLIDYVPSGAPEESPDPDEDRTQNRLLLAARLLALLRARGLAVEAEVAELRRLEGRWRAGDRDGVAARLDRLLGELDRRRAEAGEPSPAGRS